MAVKIYGIARSRAIRNVWACEEGGVPYELVRTLWTDGGTKTPEFLKLNPNGAVPAMVDGDLQWTLWAATEIESQTRIWVQQMIYLPEAERDPAVLAGALQALAKRLAIADGVLAVRPWLVGDRFTVADECTRYAQGHPTLIAEFPEVDRWIKAAQARPAFQKMWAGRMAEPA